MSNPVLISLSHRYSQLWIEHDPEDDTLGEGDAGSGAMERSSAPISTSLLSKARPYRAVAKLKVRGCLYLDFQTFLPSDLLHSILPDLFFFSPFSTRSLWAEFVLLVLLMDAV